jgi:transposase-like protein
MDLPAWVAVAVVIALVVYFMLRRARGPLACPRCSSPLPPVRAASSWREVLQGGWTCKTCGCKVDRRGREIGA